MTEAPRVSFLPSDAVAGGSLSDIDATIHKARFASWDYRGKSDAVCALLVTYLPKGYEFDGDEAVIPDHFTQAYSCGPLDKYTPSEDGTYVIAAGASRGFNKSSNVVMFFTALVNKGFPEDLLGKSDISVLDGMVVHLVQVGQPKREGLKGDSGKETFITLIDKILALPGEGAAEKPKAAVAKKTASAATAKAQTSPAAATTTPSKPVSAGSEDIIAAAQEAIHEIVTANGGKASKAEIAGKIFKALAGEKDTARKNAIIQAAYKDETLRNGPWAFDGTVVSLGG